MRHRREEIHRTRQATRIVGGRRILKGSEMESQQERKEQKGKRYRFFEMISIM